MNFSTVSAILGGRWLIDKNFVESHLPVIINMLKTGAAFDYKGMSDKDDTSEEQAAKKAELVAIQAGRGVYKVGYRTDLSSMPEESIAVVDLIGPIMKYGGMCSYGSVDKANILRNLDRAANVDGVILNVDSPGGQVDGTTLLADQIKSMSKPVVAMVDDGMMASAAMWIGSSANEIYATKSIDSFGSVGVYATLYDWATYFKSEGLPVHEIYAPQSSEKNKDYRDAMSGDYSGMKDDLSQIADTFIKTVESNRPQAAGSKEKWSKGGMFYAKEATKMGLIDGIKTFSQIVDRVSALAGKSKNSKSNQMSAGAFQRTIAAAKSESFGVVDGGFLLTEENLNNIEAELNSLDAARQESENATTQANQSLTDAQSRVTSLEADLQDRDHRITELEGQVASLQGATQSPTSTSKQADNFSDDPDEKYLTSYDREKRAKLEKLK